MAAPGSGVIESPISQSLEAGSGRPVILLHGLLGSARQWRQTLDHLAGYYHLLAPEFPFLELVNGAEGLIPGFALYVKQVMESRGIERAVLGGNSLGGHIALELAISSPEVVEGLILTGSGGLMERGFDRDLPIHPTRSYLRDKIAEVFFEERFVTEELLDRTVSLVSDRPSILKVVRIARAAKKDNLGARLSMIDCPTLLVWGREDRVTPPEVARELESRIRGAELRFLERCGHVPMVERPAEFAQIVRGFLTENFPSTHLAMGRS